MARGGDRGFERMVHRASDDVFFLGRVLSEYRALHGIDDKKLGQRLQCTHKALARLALCRRPDDREARFQEDVKRIAAFAPCNADRLVQLLREVAALGSLRKQKGKAPLAGLLMAARDRRRTRKEPKVRRPPGRKQSRRGPRND